MLRTKQACKSQPQSTVFFRCSSQSIAMYRWHCWLIRALVNTHCQRFDNCSTILVIWSKRWQSTIPVWMIMNSMASCLYLFASIAWNRSKKVCRRISADNLFFCLILSTTNVLPFFVCKVEFLNQPGDHMGAMIATLIFGQELIFRGVEQGIRTKNVPKTTFEPRKQTQETFLEFEAWKTRFKHCKKDDRHLSESLRCSQSSTKIHTKNTNMQTETQNAVRQRIFRFQIPRKIFSMIIVQYTLGTNPFCIILDKNFH